MSDEEERMTDESAFYLFLCGCYRSFRDSFACEYYRQLRDIFTVTSEDRADEMAGYESRFSNYIRLINSALLILYFTMSYYKKHTLIIGLFWVFFLTMQHGFLKNRKRPVRYALMVFAYASISFLPQAIYLCVHHFNISSYEGYSTISSAFLFISSMFIMPLGWTIGCLVGHQFRMERPAYEARLRQKTEKKIEMIALISVLQRARRIKERKA